MGLTLGASRRIHFSINLLLLIVLLCSVKFANADISFINGTWQDINAIKKHSCNTYILKAVNDTDFTGTAQYRKPCGGPVNPTCKVNGQIFGQNVTATIDHCNPSNPKAPLHCMGTLNATFSAITGTCINALGEQTKEGSLTKVVSLNDVSKSSGIATSTIKSNGIQWIDYNKDGRLD